MSISKGELQKEKAYLLKVKKVLEKLIEKGMQTVEQRTTSINDLKKFMWDNLSDYTDEERGIALYEVDQSVDITNEKIADINRYKKAKDNPYFAKIVFKDDEFEDEMPIYIGMKSVQEGINFYVYDWRAPISSMFYNYELGDAEYEAPTGVITGQLLSKMQFKIQNGKLIRCFKSDINIDDEYLQEVLSNSSTDKMKNIVSTIQREQNAIIRYDNDKYLVVQGVAGSGKTSVALHRIAYLLYKDLALKSNNVLIFSPNDVFSDYISNVLPELGEENVLKSTLNEFALAYLKPYKQIESYSEFLERVYSNKPNLTAGQTIEYKMSDQCKNDIDEFVEMPDVANLDNKTILKGEKKKIDVSIYPEDAKNKEIEFISSNPEILTVDSNGNITGIASGKATITVKAKVGDVKNEIEINVYSKVTEIWVEQKDINMQIEDEFKINAYVLPEDANNKNIIFSSKNKEIAEVDEKGIITAKTEGETEILIKSEENEEIMESCKVNVVRKMADSEIHFDTSLTVDNLEISGIDYTDNTVKNLKEKITTDLELEFLNNKNEILTESSLLGTGSKILVKENGNILRQYKIILYGDANGDGKINSVDLLVIQRHILEIESIEDIYKKASNIRKNGKNPTSVDLLLIQRHILGLQLIKQ